MPIHELSQRQQAGQHHSGPDGNLYGTTAGPAGGTIFKLTEAGQITVLHTFTTNPTTRY
jgi:uncharacterized repeat protein (TIGR03803 family)